MGTETIRLDEDVYRNIQAHNRDDETLSETVERLIGGPHPAETIKELSGVDADAVEAALEDLDERSKRGLRARASAFTDAMQESEPR